MNKAESNKINTEAGWIKPELKLISINQETLGGGDGDDDFAFGLS